MSWKRAVAVGSVIGANVALMVTLEGTVGYSRESENNVMVVSGGTTPGALVATAVLAGCYVFLMVRPPQWSPVGPGGLIRRFFAFLIDLLSSGIPMATLSGVVYSVIESNRVGRWTWQSTRDYVVPSDSHMTWLLFPLGLSLVIAYFALPLVAGRQTIGCVALGLAVKEDCETMTWASAISRVLLGLISLAGAPVTLWQAARDPARRMLHDKLTGSKVLAVRYGS